MRVLVTGGAGFIGSHTVDVLIERGHSVRVLDSLDERVHPNGPPDHLSREAEFVRGSVTERAVLAAALVEMDAVVHLAAYQDYMPDFHRFIHVNAESTALLYELIVTESIPVTKVVLASSQSVAGEGLYHCADHGDVTPRPRPLAQLERADWEARCPRCDGLVTPLLIPETVADPHTAYGISKYALELLGLRLGARYGIPTVAMRYTYVQGPRNSFYNAYSGVLRRFALQVLNGMQPTVYEDGRQMRDYVNVRDVALANVLVLERDASAFHVYNVGGGTSITVLELARLVLREFASPLEPLVTREFRLGDSRHTVSDIAALRALGWEPRVPVATSVAQYREWLAAQSGGREYLLEAERVLRHAQVIRQVTATQRR
jgi:dTDP-L-rhamnose 4-epimerase